MSTYFTIGFFFKKTTIIKICEYVSSSDNLVLLLTHYWTPLNVTSVKEGLKKLMGAQKDFAKQDRR